MKQALEETAKGTPDAAPAVIKPTKARRRNDELVVGLVLRSESESDKGKPKVETCRERELWQAADELAGPSPSPLAASLALTVALCEADVRLRQAVNRPLERRSNRDSHAAFDAAMRRYLAACKALALVQRLNLPGIQVNIAGQQVVANG